MKIRFLRPWQAYRPGQEIDTPFPGAADLLIRRGLAVEVEPQPASEPRPLPPKRR